MVGVLNINEGFLQKMWSLRLECPCDTQNCPQAGTMVSSGLAAVGWDFCSANNSRLELQKSPPPPTEVWKKTFWTKPWSVYIIYTHSCMYIYICIFYSYLLLIYELLPHFDCKGMYTRFHTESERVSLQVNVNWSRIWRRLYDGPLTDPFNNNMEVTNNRSWVDFELRLLSNSFKRKTSTFHNLNTNHCHCRCFACKKNPHRS